VSGGELRQALLGISGGVDVLVFDACLMQTAEVVSEVSDRTGWVVASLDFTCVDGLPYNDLLGRWSASSSAADIARMIPAVAVDSYRPGGSQYIAGITQTAYSAVRTDLWDAAEAAVAGFVQAALSSGDVALLHSLRDSVTAFNDREEMVDLVEYLRLAAADAADTLAAAAISAAEALEAAVPAVDDFGYADGATGRVSVWFPYYPGDFVNWREAYAEMRWGAATGWADFLALYHEERQ